MKCAIVAAVVFAVLLMYCLATEEYRASKRIIGLTAICEDGTFTTSKRGRGVCAGHGGVRKWVD